MPKHVITRREALKTSAGITAALMLGTSSSTLLSASPNEKLNLAFIGVGGRGRDNVKGLAGQNFVAFADVDDQRAAQSFKQYDSVPKFRDYRRMYDEFGSKLDGVVISTPDHMHFHPAYAAMQMGLNVYLEKPLAHNVWETRTLTDLARKKGLATQLGAQRHAKTNMHRVVELIQSGAIGDVTEVHSWVGGERGMPDVPTQNPSVPAHLDYDLWVGPAEHHPFQPSICPYGWRFWWDYGTGETGNWGCHILDIPFWSLDLKYPTRVDATGPSVDAERTPKSMHATFKFPARDEQPAVILHWYHGAPEILTQHGLSAKGNNTLFIGEKGMLLCGFDQRTLLPEEKFESFEAPTAFVPDSPGFHNEWVKACRGEEPATCFFDYSGPLAETVLLGNVAYRAGGFDWDAATLNTGDNSQAAALIREKYRKGWEI